MSVKVYRLGQLFSPQDFSDRRGTKSADESHTPG